MMTKPELYIVFQERIVKRYQDTLNKNGITTFYYHAGSRKKEEQIQEGRINNKFEIFITIAFSKVR